MGTVFAIYAAVFVAALLLSDILIRGLLAARKKDAQVNYRLELLKKKGDQLTSYEELLSQRRLSEKSPYRFSGTWLSKIYTQSGIVMNRSRLVIYIILVALLIWFLSAIFFNNFVGQAIATLILTPMVCLLCLLYARSRRIVRFVGQLANSLDIIVRSLQAGHPLPAAISLVAREMPDPVGSEFGILSDELTYGTPLDSALINMFHRVGADEVKLVAISLSVQQGTGGNLGEILENLAQVIRDRALIKAKIKAISAEGRITAVIMAMFPFFLFFMLRALVPDYFDPLWESGYGTVILSVCGSFMLFGIVILYRLVKFDF